MLPGDGDNFSDYEFQVYSQWGEDGLIQYLIRQVEIENPVFIEFGVEAYAESNTRFLLMNNNWSGLVIDGSEKNIASIKQDPIYWRYNLKAECAFIDQGNINDIIEKNGIAGDIGLLSVDIDGNDYWVWDAIDSISPRIVICEYNSIYGFEAQVTVPYDPHFYRTRAHFSNLYWGASIGALTSLAGSKGYALVGSNSAGNNLFFVRHDVMGRLKEITPQEAHTVSQFRESRDEGGNLTLLPFEARISVIKEMPLVNLADHKQYLIKELYGLR
ncbi:hypothetical protein JYT48_01300 [Mariprofundus ferrooxydans]|nr:hypothetical protein [Mariprofundus ferrooxydans]